MQRAERGKNSHYLDKEIPNLYKIMVRAGNILSIHINHLLSHPNPIQN